MMPLSPIPKKIRQREYAKRWIAKHKDDPEWRAKRVAIARKWADANPEKRYAHNKINDDLRDRRITKLPCKVCGSTRSHAHHPDYSKPKEVIWLCQIHHEEIHHPTTA